VATTTISHLEVLKAVELFVTRLIVDRSEARLTSSRNTSSLALFPGSSSTASSTRGCCLVMMKNENWAAEASGLSELELGQGEPLRI
jgi:hypothetical protein